MMKGLLQALSAEELAKPASFELCALVQKAELTQAASGLFVNLTLSQKRAPSVFFHVAAGALLVALLLVNTEQVVAAR